MSASANRVREPAERTVANCEERYFFGLAAPATLSADSFAASADSRAAARASVKASRTACASFSTSSLLAFPAFFAVSSAFCDSSVPSLPALVAAAVTLRCALQAVSAALCTARLIASDALAEALPSSLFCARERRFGGANSAGGGVLYLPRRVADGWVRLVRRGCARWRCYG